jgi:hypothetical protein
MAAGGRERVGIFGLTVTAAVGINFRPFLVPLINLWKGTARDTLLRMGAPGGRIRNQSLFSAWRWASLLLCRLIPEGSRRYVLDTPYSGGNTVKQVKKQMSWTVRNIERDRGTITAIEVHDDRSAAILAGAYLEDCLMGTIQARLASHPQPNQPKKKLNFASKIDFARSLGIYDDKIAQILHTLRSMLVRLTPKSTRFGDDFVGTLAHWMLARLSPLHFGCCQEPVYSPSYVGATACPLIPSNERNALNG